MTYTPTNPLGSFAPAATSTVQTREQGHGSVMQADGRASFSDGYSAFVIGGGVIASSQSGSASYIYPNESLLNNYSVAGGKPTNYWHDDENSVSWDLAPSPKSSITPVVYIAGKRYVLPNDGQVVAACLSTGNKLLAVQRSFARFFLFDDYYLYQANLYSYEGGAIRQLWSSTLFEDILMPYTCFLKSGEFVYFTQDIRKGIPDQGIRSGGSIDINLMEIKVNDDTFSLGATRTLQNIQVAVETHIKQGTFVNGTNETVSTINSGRTIQAISNHKERLGILLGDGENEINTHFVRNFSEYGTESDPDSPSYSAGSSSTATHTENEEVNIAYSRMILSSSKILFLPSALENSTFSSSAGSSATENATYTYQHSNIVSNGTASITADHSGQKIIIGADPITDSYVFFEALNGYSASSSSSYSEVDRQGNLTETKTGGGKIDWSILAMLNGKKIEAFTKQTTIPPGVKFKQFQSIGVVDSINITYYTQKILQLKSGVGNFMAVDSESVFAFAPDYFPGVEAETFTGRMFMSRIGGKAIKEIQSHERPITVTDA